MEEQWTWTTLEWEGRPGPRSSGVSKAFVNDLLLVRSPWRGVSDGVSGDGLHR